MAGASHNVWWLCLAPASSILAPPARSSGSPRRPDLPHTPPASRIPDIGSSILAAKSTGAEQGPMVRAVSARPLPARFLNAHTPEDDSMDITVSQHEGKRPVTVLTVTGTVDSATHDKLEEEGRAAQSEESRVGKECRSRWSPYH